MNELIEYLKSFGWYEGVDGRIYNDDLDKDSDSWVSLLKSMIEMFSE